MFRPPLLPCACLAAAIGLALAVMPTPARSQDRSTYERLDRLERDLNMLQRQVYRGAPPPAGGSPGAAVSAELRMDRIETQMRDLTGRVEEVMNQVEQVRQRIEQLGGDGDMRLGQAPGGPGALASPARPGPAGRLPFPPESAVSPDDEPGPPRLAGPTALTPPGGPSPIFGTLTPPGAAPAAPSHPAELASTGRPPAAGMLPSGSTTEQYNYAFGLLKQADYPAAEAALKSFVDSHPKDPMAGNAQYWLGETYYTRARYMEAATAFAEGYKRYPKSPKAPDSLLKLGMSLARANQQQNACVALGQLDHDFPHAGASVKERAAAEKKRLGC